MNTHNQPLSKPAMLRLLRADNPKARADDLAVYVDAFLEYREAQENIERNGSVVAHPRTGAPLPNPYIAVKTSALRVLASSGKRLNTSALWEDDDDDA